MADQPRLEPLKGIRALDFTTFPPGAAASVMLSDLGADVVRIEPPSQKGKPSLVIGQVALGRCKRSITLDLRNPASTSVLLRLAKTSDLVIENARPGAMEARGFGYAHASKENPQLIWCAITGFGQDGPYADHSGHDLSYLAQSGLLGALSGGREWHPGLPIALQAGALVAVVAIQSALLSRASSGEGSFIDTSLSEAATWFLTCGFNPFSESPFALPASPDRHLYRCADGRTVAIACAEPRTWTALFDGLEVPELLDTLHKWQDPAATIAQLAGIFAKMPARHWMDILVPKGAAITVVNHGAHVVDDPHVKARRAVVQVADSFVPATPVRIATSGGLSSATSTVPPARVGDDTEAVLREAEFTEEEIRQLSEAGLV